VSGETASLGREFQSIRLGLFEVYEEGSDFPLVIVSDRTLLTDLQPTDRVVLRHWVREGGAS
jgi:hypothetical protein